MKKDNIHKEPSESQRTNILLEEIRGDVKIVAEGHGIIIKRLDGHDKKFERIENELDFVKTDLNLVKTDLGIVKNVVLDLSGGLSRLERKVDENLASHDKRITRLEEKVFL